MKQKILAFCEGFFYAMGIIGAIWLSLALILHWGF